MNMNIEEILGKNFISDEYNREIVPEIYNYFFRGDGKLDSKRGILLIGKIGCGKTRLMKNFSDYLMWRNEAGKFRIYNVRQVQWDFVKNGYDGIQQYMNNPTSQGEHPNDICFDDLGTELRSVKNFGNDIAVMEEVLYARYELFPKKKTHLITNLDIDSLKERYSERLVSRFREMFNVVNLPGEDRRNTQYKINEKLAK